MNCDDTKIRKVYEAALSCAQKLQLNDDEYFHALRWIVATAYFHTPENELKEALVDFAASVISQVEDLKQTSTVQ